MNILKFSIFFTLIFSLFSCGSGIDKENFNLVEYIEDNDGIIQELKNLDVDSAYIQFIGFPPSTDIEDYINFRKEGKIGKTAWETNRVFFNDDHTEEFFSSLDLDHPILVIWAKRKITVKGNSFNDMGISSGDLVDYEDGVNKSEAKLQHSFGDYSNTSYEWSRYYLVKVKDKFLMLSNKYVEDREIIGFFQDLIIMNKNYVENYAFSSTKVAFYEKNKPIRMVPQKRLNDIKQNELVYLEWTTDEQNELEVNLDKVFSGSAYKITDEKDNELVSGIISPNDNLSNLNFYIDCKNIPNGKIKFKIGTFLKKTILKSFKSLNSYQWTSNIGSSLQIKFNSDDNTFEMILSGEGIERRTFEGQFNVNGDRVDIISGELKSVYFNGFDGKSITLDLKQSITVSSEEIGPETITLLDLLQLTEERITLYEF